MDVLVQNLKPGSLEKIGLDRRSPRSRFPELITCNISRFGEDGEFSHLKAYDLIVQAETGLCAITGTAEDPARVGVSVCDIAAGMYAHEFGQFLEVLGGCCEGELVLNAAWAS